IAARAAQRLDRQEATLVRIADQDGEAAVDPVDDAVPGPPPAAPRAAEGRGGEVIGGDVLEGIRNVLRSPYLLGIAALMLFFTISATFLYFQQAALTELYVGEDSARRTRFFANIDLLVNALTLVTQVFVTGRMLRWLGVGLSLAFLPLV